VAGRVKVLVGSWADPVDGVMADILIANPPYIPTAVLESLDREVRDHEPRLALDGGDDGLDAYRALLPSAARILAADGWAAFETDIGAAGEVEVLGAAALGGSPRTHPDLTGRPRVVTVDRGRGGRTA
jgi:release factor glutamine methyltransferase